MNVHFSCSDLKNDTSNYVENMYLLNRNWTVISYFYINKVKTNTEYFLYIY